LQRAASPTPRRIYKKENPMSQMTKRALVASLKELLAEKPLDKITVTDLTEHCGVNRMTFYYHFKDIYDLVEWACIESATRALAGQKTYDTWQQGFLRIFEEVRDNKVFIMNVYRCVSREQVERYIEAGVQTFSALIFADNTLEETRDHMAFFSEEIIKKYGK